MGYSILTHLERDEVIFSTDFMLILQLDRPNPRVTVWLRQIRYTAWIHLTADFVPRFNETYATELYNHTADPEENRNVYAATDPAVLAQLESVLKKESAHGA